MDNKDLGRSAEADGLSPTVEPVPVSPAVAASIPSAWPPVEYESSYPIDEEFSDFEVVPMNFHEAARWLLAELPRAAKNMPCFCSVEDGVDRHFGKDVKLIEFSTGGWSGAESIIGLINRRFDLRHFMLSWHRGGHYVFELPARFIASGMQLREDAPAAEAEGLQPDPKGDAQSQSPASNGGVQCLIP